MARTGLKPTPTQVLGTVVVRVPPRFLYAASRGYNQGAKKSGVQLYDGAYGIPEEL